jgi:hypothetical protein
VNKISTPVVLDLKIETCHIFRNIAVKWKYLIASFIIALLCVRFERLTCFNDFFMYLRESSLRIKVVRAALKVKYLLS